MIKKYQIVFFPIFLFGGAFFAYRYFSRRPQIKVNRIDFEKYEVDYEVKAAELNIKETWERGRVGVFGGSKYKVLVSSYENMVGMRLRIAIVSGDKVVLQHTINFTNKESLQTKVDKDPNSFFKIVF